MQSKSNSVCGIKGFKYISNPSPCIFHALLSLLETFCLYKQLVWLQAFIYLLRSFNYFGGLVSNMSSQTVLTFCKRDLEHNSLESHYKLQSTEMRRRKSVSPDIPADRVNIDFFFCDRHKMLHLRLYWQYIF